MSDLIKLKRSAVPSNPPTTAQLQLGELAINTYDGKLYIKKDNGTASIVEIGAVGNLDSLTDVVITTPSTNQIIRYNGTNWVNSNETTELPSQTGNGGKYLTTDGTNVSWVPVSGGSSIDYVNYTFASGL